MPKLTDRAFAALRTISTQTPEIADMVLGQLHQLDHAPCEEGDAKREGWIHGYGYSFAIHIYCPDGDIVVDYP